MTGLRRRQARGSADGVLTKILLWSIGSFVAISLLMGQFGGSGSGPAPPPAPFAPYVVPVLTECGPRGKVLYDGIDVDGNRGTWCQLTYLSGRFNAKVGMPVYPPGCDATWQVREAKLCTSQNTRIEGFKFVDGSLRISGQPAAGYDKVDPRWNCHGDTFTGGEFWVMPDQVEVVLRDEFEPVNNPQDVRRDDIVVYQNSIVYSWRSNTLDYPHSTHVVLVTPTETWTFGKRGQDPVVSEKRRPAGPGPGAAWEDTRSQKVFYRRKPGR